MSSLFYAIIYSTAGVIAYSAIIYTGYRKSVREHRRVRLYLLNLKEVIEDIKQVITREENEVLDKGPYKNTRTSEHGGMEAMFFKHKKEFVNELTLSALINNKPTDDDYDTAIAILTELAQSTYNEFKFLIMKSPDEVADPHFIQIVSTHADNPELHAAVFATAMNANLDYVELVKRFAAHVAAGNVIDLGEDVAVITEDGTNMIPTGVSNLVNGLENSEITFNISFINKTNLDAFNKKHLPQPAPTPVEAPQEPAKDSTNG